MARNAEKSQHMLNKRVNRFRSRVGRATKHGVSPTPTASQRPLASPPNPLSRYLSGMREELAGEKKKRPHLAALCDDVHEADRWRNDVIREASG